MKTILPLVLLVALMASCNSKPTTALHAAEYVKGTAVYGDSIQDVNVIDLASVSTAMQDKSKMDMKIRGQVNEVCKKKGCWMIMKLSNGDDMRVTFKDYKIFVPKDLTGKEVILEGFAFTDTTSVEDQRHYAKDGGKSEAEIAKITTPKKELSFEAKGVVVMN
jgi:hypothetical protein